LTHTIELHCFAPCSQMMCSAEWMNCYPTWWI